MNNFRQFRSLHIVNSFIILSPLIFGIVIEKRWIPAMILPIECLISYWITGFALERRETHNEKIIRNVLCWLTYFSFGISMAYLIWYRNTQFRISILINGMLGLLFMALGNIMPKAQQNQVFGIRTFWTLNNKENWIYTQRFAGHLWVVCGFAMLATSFIPNGEIVIWIFIAAAVIGPILYSYFYAKKHDQIPKEKKRIRKRKILGSALLFAFIVGVVVVFLSGKYTISLNKQELVIDANFVYDTTIDFSKIDSVELVENVKGSKVFGYNAFFCNMGTYRNDELGEYTRYTDFSGKAIQIRTDNQTFVINEKNDYRTKQLYEQILANLSVKAAKKESAYQKS